MWLYKHTTFPAMISQLISYLNLFIEVTPQEKALITARCTTRSYTQGEYFLRAGEYCRRIGFVCRGVFRIYVLNSAGEEATSYFMDENRFITNLEPLQTTKPATEYIQASTDAELVVIPKDLLTELEAIDGKWSELIGTITQKSLLEKVYLRNSFLGENATARYQKFLVQQPQVALRVPLQHVASYLGILPQSLSRIRRSLLQLDSGQSRIRKTA